MSFPLIVPSLMSRPVIAPAPAGGAREGDDSDAGEERDARHAAFPRCGADVPGARGGSSRFGGSNDRLAGLRRRSRERR
jgi:hypothetical protein